MNVCRVSDLKDRMRNETGLDAAFEGMWRRVKAAVGASSREPAAAWLRMRTWPSLGICMCNPNVVPVTAGLTMTAGQPSMRAHAQQLLLPQARC